MDVAKIKKDLLLIDAFKSLSDQELSCVAPFVQLFEFKQGDVIARQGYPIEGLYVILDGRVALSVQLFGDQVVQTGQLKRGDVFGDVSLLQCDPAVSTIEAQLDTKCYFLSQQVFHSFHLVYPVIGNKISGALVGKICRQIRHSISEVKGVLDVVQEVPSIKSLGNKKEFNTQKVTKQFIKENELVLKKLSFFKSYTDMEFKRLIKCFQYIEVSRDTLLYEEGSSEVDQCYLVLKGAIQSTVHHHRKTVKLAVYGPGKLVGLLGFFDKQSRMATCVVREDALLLCIDQHEMIRLKEKNSQLYYKCYDMLYSAMSDMLGAAVRRLIWFMAERKDQHRPIRII